MNAKPQMLFGQDADGKPIPIPPVRPAVALLRFEIIEPDGENFFTLNEMARRCRCKPDSLRNLWMRQHAIFAAMVKSPR